MMTIAAVTLGCKVNQYDTRAMVERFLDRGYMEVSADGAADVVLINTCTVTGESDRKSRQLIRRALRGNPGASVIVAGCLAQRDPESLMMPGVRLILGTQRRAEVAELFERAVESGAPTIAVERDIQREYEPLAIESGTEGRTRAALKIEEGCECRCAYCVIPDVRGPVRSRSLEDIAREATRLGEKGYVELTLTGVNLSAYGSDLPARDGVRLTLADAARAAAEASGASRIRLSSLEPTLITPGFVDEIVKIAALCPHFPLALQSGSDGTLRRMRRQYSTDRYRRVVALLREAYPGAAFTTDIMVGFPGETDGEFEESLAFVREIGFSRAHVFPYSPREGTPAAAMDGQVSSHVKRERVGKMIELGQELEHQFICGMIGRVRSVLFEQRSDVLAQGYTPEYVWVSASGALPGETRDVCLIDFASDGALGVLI